jgi:ectoine hydroxylase-related dioxygenase (phytanoyl-CoA dioxygenase family)
MHFWIPFQAATPQSGCLSYVPGSHRAGLLPHSSFGKSSYGGLICDEVDTTKAVVCPIPVGTVCMHTPTTIHSAHDNTSDSLSCAWTIHFSPYGRLLSWRPSHVAMRMRKFFGRPRLPAKAFARA